MSDLILGFMRVTRLNLCDERNIILRAPQPAAFLELFFRSLLS